MVSVKKCSDLLEGAFAASQTIFADTGPFTPGTSPYPRGRLGADAVAGDAAGGASGGARTA